MVWMHERYNIHQNPWLSQSNQKGSTNLPFCLCADFFVGSCCCGLWKNSLCQHVQNFHIFHDGLADGHLSS